MSRAIAGRLQRLEAASPRQVVIWCEDEADMEQTIAAMIAAGEIAEADRPYCVHWTKASCLPGAHEERLEELD